MERETITLSALCARLWLTSSTDACRFLRTCLQEDFEPLDTIPIKTQLQLVLLDWLAQYDIITDAQRQEIVHRMTTCLADLAEQWKENPQVIPAFLFDLTDCRFAACSGRETFYDCQEGRELEALPARAVTHWTCDVSAALLSVLERINAAKLGGMS